MDVVIDPILSKRLRAHQVEGVKFMYEVRIILIVYSFRTQLTDVLGNLVRYGDEERWPRMHTR